MKIFNPVEVKHCINCKYFFVEGCDGCVLGKWKEFPNQQYFYDPEYAHNPVCVPSIDGLKYALNCKRFSGTFFYVNSITFERGYDTISLINGSVYSSANCNDCYDISLTDGVKDINIRFDAGKHKEIEKWIHKIMRP